MCLLDVYDFSLHQIQRPDIHGIAIVYLTVLAPYYHSTNKYQKYLWNVISISVSHINDLFGVVCFVDQCLEKFWAKSVKILLILNPTGYMLTSSDYALLILSIFFYRFL